MNIVPVLSKKSEARGILKSPPPGEQRSLAGSSSHGVHQVEAPPVFEALFEVMKPQLKEKAASSKDGRERRDEDEAENMKRDHQWK